MAKTPNLVPLKLLVISLGFLLVGGMVFVLTTLVNKANKMSAGECADVSVSLSALHVKGSIGALFPQGNTVQVMVHDAATTHMLTLDRCSGNLLHHLTITP